MIKNFKNEENGNVLFLILIAVALFAALSYAVTQSSRSGSGNANKEQAGINAAQLTQYPAGIRTAVIRMIIGGVDITALEFNPPSGDYDGLTSDRVGVFHPDGGGATFVQAPEGMMADGEPGDWYFNAEFEIKNIGTAGGNEYLAFLPGITKGVCDRVNEDLGITGDIIMDAAKTAAYTTDYTTYMDESYTVPGTPVIIGDAEAEGLIGQAFGCFDNAGEYVYYHLLHET